MRRSLAVTAVTALASSAALYAAPVAFAVDSTPTATTTPTAAAPAAGATTAATAAATAPATTAASADGKAAPKSEPKSDPKAADEGPSVRPGDVVPNDEKGNGPAIAFTGLPKSFAAGVGPVSFTATIDNNTGADVRNFLPFIFITSESGKLAPQHLLLESQDPRTGKWGQILLKSDNEDGQAILMGHFGERDPEASAASGPIQLLRKGEKLNIAMRVTFAKDAPLGLGAAFIAGVGGQGDDAAVDSASDIYIFEITKAGEKPSDVIDFKPVKPKPKPKPKPGSQLAETGGNDSSATTWAVAGGAALVGGAGLLVVMRRRKAGTAA